MSLLDPGRWLHELRAEFEEGMEEFREDLKAIRSAVERMVELMEEKDED